MRRSAVTGNLFLIIASIANCPTLFNNVKYFESFSNFLILEERMAQKPRRDEILKYLEENGFATVNELVELLHYSSATVYRDLNELEHLNLVKRSYGGVELAEKRGKLNINQRYDYMRPEKRMLARTAAEYVKDGETVFFIGSSTVEYMTPYLNGKKFHAITHNIRMVEHFSEMGIDVTCLGGKMFDAPSILMGDDTVECAMKYHVDKAFLSPTGFTEDGQIDVTAPYYLIYRVMMKNAKKVYLLVDHSKLGKRSDRRLCDFSAIDCVIGDIEFSEETKAMYPDTEFLCVKSEEK